MSVLTAPARTLGHARSRTNPAMNVVAMVGLVSLWIVAQLLFFSGHAEARSQALLYDRLRVDLASATAPTGGVITPGTPVARLTIARLGLDAVVVEGTASGDLLAGPGHRRDTPLPGQAGTSVLYGRAATYGGPFADLVDLVPGDRVKSVTSQGEKMWKVISVRHAGDELPQPAKQGRARMTLVSAVGSGSMSTLSPSSSIYVDLEAKKAFPTPPGRAAAVPAAELAMGTDQGALPLLVLYLALLVALTLAVLAAIQRWSTAVAWVLATPIAIALAWQTTDVVMRLLPNLI